MEFLFSFWTILFLFSPPMLLNLCFSYWNHEWHVYFLSSNVHIDPKMCIFYMYCNTNLICFKLKTCHWSRNQKMISTQNVNTKIIMYIKDQHFFIFYFLLTACTPISPVILTMKHCGFIWRYIVSFWHNLYHIGKTHDNRPWCTWKRKGHTHPCPMKNQALRIDSLISLHVFGQW